MYWGVFHVLYCTVLYLCLWNKTLASCRATQSRFESRFVFCSFTSWKTFVKTEQNSKDAVCHNEDTSWFTNYAIKFIKKLKLPNFRISIPGMQWFENSQLLLFWYLDSATYMYVRKSPKFPKWLNFMQITFLSCCCLLELVIFWSYL